MDINNIISETYNVTIPQILAKNAEKYGKEKAAIREKAYGIWQRYSWADYYGLSLIHISEPTRPY